MDDATSSYKRRFTLVTAEEPIPSDVDNEQPNDDGIFVCFHETNFDIDALVSFMMPGEYNENEDGDGDYEDDEEEGEEDSYEGEYSEEDIGDLDDEPIVVEPSVPVPRTFEEMQNMYQPKNNKSFESEPLRQEKASVTFAACDEFKTIEEPIIETSKTKTIEENPNSSVVTNDGNEEEEHEDAASVDEEDANEDADEDEDVEDDEADDSEAAEDEEDEEDEEELDDDDEDEEHGSEEELSDVDDTDLMKRLESKYGKLPDARDSDEDGGADDKSWTSNTSSK